MSTFSKIAQGLRLTGVSGATNDMVGNWLKGLGLAGATPDMLFTYLRSTGLTGSLSDMLSAYVFSSGTVFIDLSPTSNGFYSLGTSVTFAGDFEISGSFYYDGANNSTIFGNALNNNNFLELSTSGVLTSRISGATSGSTSGAVSLNILNKFKWYRAGSVVKLELNGVQIISYSTGLNLTLDFIGRSNTSNFFSGIISNVKLTDITTPANSLEFKLNKLTANSEYPVNNVFGSEEISNNTFNNATGWSSPRSSSTISVVSNKLRSTATSTGTFGSVIELTGLVVGKAYSLLGSATSNNSGAVLRIRVADSSSLNAPVIDKSGTEAISVDSNFTATATTMYAGTIVTGHSAGDYIDIDAGISIKSVTNVINYNNIGTGIDVRDTYTLINGDYLGSELITNGDFATDFNGWNDTVYNPTKEIIGGEARLTGGTFRRISQQISTNIGADYVISSPIRYVSGADGVQIKVSESINLDSAFENSAVYFGASTSTQALEFTALTNTYVGPSQSGDVGEFFMDSFSVKRKIEVA